MRSTIALEPAVQRPVEKDMRRDKASFKEVVNAAIRRGLSEPRRTTTEIQLRAFKLGLLPGIDAVSINAVLDVALAEYSEDAIRRAK